MNGIALFETKSGLLQITKTIQMKTYLDQITIYYNPTINKHKKTVAHAESIGKILAIPFEEMPKANNLWTTIYEGLGEKAFKIFKEDFKSTEGFNIKDYNNWYKVASHNLDQIESPIAIKGEQVVFCDRQTEIYELMDTAV
jgi:arsenate reductase-like glutaredoxin family protein